MLFKRLPKLLLAPALALAMSCAVFAEDELPIPDDKFVYCTVCHGVQVMGNEHIQAPRLSGMEPWYVERQLQAFNKGWRGAHESDLVGMEMRPMASGLSQVQIAEVAQFVHAARSERPQTTIGGDARKGRPLFQSCAACHGANGEGNSALGGPALTGLNDWYLVRQLRNYKSGIRGSRQEDTYGVQMAAATALLADDDAILDVVAYITSIDED